MEKPTTIKEEIKALEQKLAEKKRELTESGIEVKPEAAAREVVREYIAPAAQIPASQTDDDDQIKKTAQSIKEEPHYRQIEELLKIAEKNGILNAVEVAKHLKNPHLLDDFHDRIVAELLKEKK